MRRCIKSEVRIQLDWTGLGLVSSELWPFSYEMISIYIFTIEKMLSRRFFSMIGLSLSWHVIRTCVGTLMSCEGSEVFFLNCLLLTVVL